MDENAFKASRGKFAKVCVEVDLNRPVLLKFRLNRRVRHIEYEVFHQIYFHCGYFDHCLEGCPEVIIAQKERGVGDGAMDRNSYVVEGEVALCDSHNEAPVEVAS